MEITTTEESREYPSRLFFMDQLLKEAIKVSEMGTPVEDLLDQLREIWTAPHREAILSQLERYAFANGEYRFPDKLQEPVADALKDVVRVADSLSPGNRHKADTSVSRLCRNLDPHLSMEVVTPWLQDSRKFRVNAVMRAITRVNDRTPYADYLVSFFRAYGFLATLELIAKTPPAAAQIGADELDHFFQAYIDRFVDNPEQEGKFHKYPTMIAASVLIVGENRIPPSLLRSIPEIFTWAIDNIGDPKYESMLIWLMVEHHENPRVLWSALRTASRRQMPKAMERGLELARELLAVELGATTALREQHPHERQSRLDLPEF